MHSRRTMWMALTVVGLISASCGEGAAELGDSREEPAKLDSFTVLTETTTDALVTTLASDSFNRLDSTDLGTLWNPGYTGQTSFKIVANQASGTSTARSMETFSGVTLPSNQFAQVTLSVLTSDASPGVLLRFAAAPTVSGYACRTDGGRNAYISKWVSGTQTVLTNVSASFVAGDAIRCEAEGTALRMYRVRSGGSTLVTQASDATYSNGRSGIVTLSTTGRVDDFSTGSVGCTGACVCSVAAGPALFDRSAAVAGIARSTTDVAVVDVDRDGRLDVIWASQRGGGTGSDGGIDVSLNRGGGVFSTIDIGTKNNLGDWTFVAPVDVNKDSFPDLVMTRPAMKSTEILLLKNQRDGGFSADSTALPLITSSVDGLIFGRVAVSDIDRDGDLDLIVPVAYNSSFSADRPNILLINDGTGKFARDTLGRLPPIAGGYDYTFCVAAGDVNGDGAPDLFLGEAERRQRLLINNGSGKFSDQSDNDGTGRARLPSTPMRGAQCQMIDADRDGDLDVVVVNDVATYATLVTQAPQLFVNDGTGHFSLRALPVPPGGPYDNRGMAFGDVNGDKIPDLVISSDKYSVPNNGHAVDLLLGQCDGGFAYSSALPPLDKGIHGVAIGDLDGDGKPEIVGAVATPSAAGSYQNLLLRSQ